jgi:hypothetical protein
MWVVVKKTEHGFEWGFGVDAAWLWIILQILVLAAWTIANILGYV